MPSPTIDWKLDDAMAEISIEDRAAAEVRYVHGRNEAAQPARIALADEATPVANPAFDITPARLVTGIITERGVAAPCQLEALFAPSRAAA